MQTAPLSSCRKACSRHMLDYNQKPHLHSLKILQKGCSSEVSLAHAHMHIAGLVGSVLNLPALEVPHSLWQSTAYVTPPVQRIQSSVRPPLLSAEPVCCG